MFEAAIRSHPSATGNVTATKETVVATNILALAKGRRDGARDCSKLT